MEINNETVWDKTVVEISWPYVREAGSLTYTESIKVCLCRKRIGSCDVSISVLLLVIEKHVMLVEY